MAAVNPWVIFAVASAAVFLVSLDATIAEAAFPALRLAFAEATPAHISWVSNAHTILYAALLVPAGRLVDLYGSFGAGRRMAFASLQAFSLFCGSVGKTRDGDSSNGPSGVTRASPANQEPSSSTGSFP
jgi:MFS family permease